VIRDGRALTAPQFGARLSRDFPFAAALSKRLGQPVRLLNDAEVQGFGIVTGKGLEVVLTLGTGAGTSVFREGVLMPHLEFAQHPIHDDQTYNDYIGSKALQRKGVKKWSRRVRKTIKILASLLHYGKLYLGLVVTGAKLLGHLASFRSHLITTALEVKRLSGAEEWRTLRRFNWRPFVIITAQIVGCSKLRNINSPLTMSCRRTLAL
jgi:hypothetical protein